MANDAHISGSGRITGGDYNEIHISGSGKWDGPIRCRSFHVSGSCRGQGTVTVLEDLHCSGSLRNEGHLDAGEISVSGSARVEGNVAGREAVHVSGSLQCHALYGGEVSISGGLKTESDVEATSFRLTGGGEISGLLNAEEVDICIGLSIGKPIRIGQIGGSEIRVRRRETISLLGRLFRDGKLNSPAVVVQQIEGDEIDLTGVQADVVRGTDIVIREGCEIGRIEHSGELTVEDGAKVGERVYVG